MRLLMVTLVTVAALSAVEVHAQRQYGWDTFWHRTGVSFKRMNHYPEPFIYADREATREPFRIMIANGWQMQNTIGSHYFNPESQELTRAGERKVHSIVTRSPEQFRTVYVLQGNNPDVTAVRLDSVQTTIARLIPSGAMPEVLATNVEPRGLPGEYVDDTYRKAQSSQPVPVLPASGNATN